MKILVIICTAFVPWGGLTTVAMNYYRAMNKDGMIIDFASTNDAEEKLVDELESNGGEYFKLPQRKKIFSYVSKLYSILKDYDVIHIHGNSATMSLELFPAVLCRVPKRIVHCHTTQPTAKALSKFLRPAFLKMYTQAIAVSKEAGVWLYGEDNFVVLNNAISVKKYQFDNKLREEVRRQLRVSKDTIIFGHVGKIYEPKNHPYLIRIFYQIKKRKKDSILLLVGDGPMKKEIEDLADDLKLSDSVIFAGMSNDTVKWMQAMDCFIFPSLWEGFSLALAEAQANGLKCFVSKGISEKSNIIGNVEILDLDEGEVVWTEKICNSSYQRMKSDEVVAKFRKAHLDISLEADHLRVIYYGKVEK